MMLKPVSRSPQAFYAKGFAILLAMLSARVIHAALLDGPAIPGVVAVSCLLLLATGLAFNRPGTRHIVACISIFLAMMIPVGVLNPFAVGDYLAQGVDPPSVHELLLWVIPLVVFLLVSAYVLDYRVSEEG